MLFPSRSLLSPWETPASAPRALGFAWKTPEKGRDRCPHAECGPGAVKITLILGTLGQFKGDSGRVR